MFASLLLGGVSTTFVGCKDYDDDIDNLNTQTSDLSKQLADLKAAESGAKATAEAAKASAEQALKDAAAAAAKGDDAATAAAEAMAEAQAAKQAAETAKAEALAEAIKKAEELVNNASKATAEEIAALAGRIDGIQAGLSNIDLEKIDASIGANAQAIADQAKAIETINTQLKTFEEFKKIATEKLGSIDEIKAKLDKIAVLEGELNTLKTSVSAIKATADTNKADIAALTTALGTANTKLGELSEKITTEVNNALNAIAATMDGRLTSVTLKPDLYVGGIPTIAFESAKYNNLVYDKTAKDWVRNTKGQVAWIINNGATEAHYRLNPATLKDEDININDLSYVTRIASTRAGDEKATVVKVAKAKVGADGTLIVNVTKNNTESLNLTSDASKIYTVSLKVPIAKEHLFKGEGAASVYSEYTRVAETYFEPELRFVPGQNLDRNRIHLTDSATLYDSSVSELIDKKLVYDKTYDLYELVEGCKVFDSKDIPADNNHQPLTRAQLNAYGLDIVFGHPTTPYLAKTADKTDQQQFYTLSGENGSILTPVAPGAGAGNQAIIGKEPIVRAMLVDTKNNNVIEVSYLKVQFTAQPMKDIVFNLNVDSKGNQCTGASYDFTWDYMIKNVFVKLNDGKGMSKEEFWKIYGENYQITNTTAQSSLVVNVIPNGKPVDAIPVMSWDMTIDDLAALNTLAVNKLIVGNNVAAPEKKVTFIDPKGLNPNIVLNLKWTVTTPVAKPTLGETDPLKWKNENMLVYPVPMKLVNGAWNGVTAYYDTNILEGRIQPLVKGLASCEYYDLDYAPHAGVYWGEALDYKQLGHWQMTTANQKDLKQISYVIDNTAAGKALVSGKADGSNNVVTLNWSADINGKSYNRYVFATSTLEIVKILSLHPSVGEAIIDNSVEQKFNIGNKFTMKDAFGNLVAKKATTAEPYAYDYWQYYGITNVSFQGEIKVANNVAGTEGVRTLASLHMTANVSDATGELVFQNNGSPLQADAYLIVPVTVTHKWGVLKGTIAVPLKKKL